MASGTELGKAYVQIIPSAQGISGSISGLMGGEASAAGKTAGSALGGSLVKSLSGVIAAAGIGKLVTDAITTGMDFDKSMSQVAATMGTTVDQIGELRDFAKEMGATTAFSATEAADALNYMALAGYDAETSMKMLPNVLNLAAAGGIELARASDMVTDAQTALGLSLDETSAMVDQMAKASSKSNTSVEQLGDAFLTIGANARKARGGTAELSTVLGVLADNGIKGSEAGTHLRNIMLAMNPTTDAAARAWEKLGVAAYDSEGNLRSLPMIFNDLDRAMEGMTDEEKTDLFSKMFNKTDLASIQALVGTTAERFSELNTEILGAWFSAESLYDSFAGMGIEIEDAGDKLSVFGISAEEFEDAIKSSEGNVEYFIEYLQAIADPGTTATQILDTMGVSLQELQAGFDGATGAAQAMADTQLDNLSGDITILKSAFEGLQISLSDGLAPVLRGIVGDATEFTQRLTEAIQAGDTEGITTAIKEAITKGLQGAFDGIVGGLNFVSENSDTIVQYGNDFVTTISDSISENAPTVLPAAADAILSTMTSLLDNKDELTTAGENLLDGLIDGMINAEGVMAEKMPLLVTKMGEALIINAPKMLNLGKMFQGHFIDGMKEKIIEYAAGGGNIGDLVSPIAEEIAAHRDELINSGRSVIAHITGGMSENFIMLFQVGGELINSLAQKLGTDIAAKIPEEGKTVVVKFINEIKNKISEVINAAKEIINGVVTGIKSGIANVLTAAAELVTKLKEKISNNGWLDTGKEIISGIISGVKSMGESFIQAVVSLCSGALDAVKKFFGISSPSKVMADEVGRYIPEGIAMGIEQYSGAVTDAMDDLKTDALDAAQMDINASGNFSVSDNNAVLARMDLMISLMTKYFPELEKQIPEGYTFNAINRQLGTALL